MRKPLRFVLVGLGAVTIAGAAMAAGRNTHVMTVPLPDGSNARVEYVGSVAPKVTVVPGAAQPFAPFGLFDRSAFDMQRQMDAMMRQIQAMAEVPITAAPGLNVAAFGAPPTPGSSVTVVSTSTAGKTCTRVTESTSQGTGKPPKVTTKVSGDCSSAAEATPDRPTV